LSGLGERGLIDEVYERFRSLAEWQTWAGLNRYIFDKDHQAKLIEHIRSQGVIDPLTTSAYHREQVVIAHDNYRETIKAGSIISRHRALLMELKRVASQGREHLITKKCRVYAPEGLTEFALYLRGMYPKFIGSEFSETSEERQALFPIPSEDLHALSFPDGVFDLVLSNDVFEHLHDLDRALCEISRVLNDDGVLIATFPFLFQSNAGIVKARLIGTRVEHLAEPEYHGNPMRPDEGALVFELPGWDIISRARAAHFSDCYFAFISSARHGIVGKDINGVFVFIAVKQDQKRTV
jgi:SAM-dependent methyltransferase